LSKHILVVGSGSIGKRHARNLHALGCRISSIDPRNDRLAELAAETPVEGQFATVEDALRAGTAYDGAVIGSPPSVHVAQTIVCLQARMPVLLEKPVAPTLEAATRLTDAARATAVPVLLGYTWRWWPPLRRVRELLGAQAIGPLRHVQFHMSAHLADWHPWERYQDFFMASRALGGGALLDESHWIDLALWLFGLPAALSARVEKLSDLAIDSDDNVDMLMVYPDNLRINVHLDIYGRPHEKFIRFVGEGGTLLWSADPNRVSVGHESIGWTSVEDFTCERNDMFVAVVEEFLDVLGGAPVTTCTLEDGLRVLKVIEAARAASAEGRTVTLDA